MAFEAYFQKAFFYLAAALIAVLLGKRSGLGAVLGYLAVGAALGPWGLDQLGHNRESVTHFAEFGVVVMLFLIGMELHPAQLWRMRRNVFGLGTAQVLATTLAVGGGLLAFGLDWKPALAIGMTVALSSTAIVLQTLREKGLLRTEAGQHSFAVLLFQDVAVIPMLAILPLLGQPAAAASAGGESSALAGAPEWLKAVLVPAAVILIVVVGRIGLRPIFRLIARTGQREAFTACALLLVIGVALLMTKVGLSPALGAFVAGVVLASSEYRHELESDLDPFRGLLLGLFFMGVGAGIDFGYIREHLALVLGGTLALLVVKAALLFLLALLHGNTANSAWLFAVSLAAGGEFAFVLINLAGTSGVYADSVIRPLSAMIALSMAMTPLLIEGVRRSLLRQQKSSPADAPSDVADEGHPVIICGFGRFGHAVGRLLRLNGFGCTVLDRDSDQVELLRQVGVPVYYGDAGRADLLATAGAANARVLIVALRDPATTVRIIESARRYFPHLKIFVRAWSRLEVYEYLAAGQDRIYRDTLDSSLRMGIDVLRELGLEETTAERAACHYRRRDEELTRSMAKLRKDDKAFLNAAREAVRTLDELVRSDLNEPAPPPPSAGPPRS